MNKLNLSLSILDHYLFRELISPFWFAIAACTIVSELVGISFEQINFVSQQGLSIESSVAVHFFKLPAFISFSLPFALLLATVISYSKLSRQSEIIALQSCGLSLFRLLLPALIFSLLITILTFISNETIAPIANYKAAIFLEKEFGIDRTILEKYNKQNFIYPSFKNVDQESNIEFILVADRVNGNELKNMTLLNFKDRRLEAIIVCESAKWFEVKNNWNLVDGSQYLINANGSYAVISYFERLSLNLPKQILEYAVNNRDLREMNIIELYQRLAIINNINDLKKIRVLKMNIQKRYAQPCSCLVFSFLGSIVGMTIINLKKINGLEIVAAIIFIYYTVQLITTALVSIGFLPVILGIWLPDILGVALGCLLLLFRNEICFY